MLALLVLSVLMLLANLGVAGFVTPEDSSEDIYINIKVIRDAGLEALENGQAVGYESGAGQNGRPSVIKLTVF